MRTEIFLERIFLARYPNTKSIASMTLDFPLPLGPTMDVKHCRERGREKEERGESDRVRENGGEGGKEGRSEVGREGKGKE